MVQDDKLRRRNQRPTELYREVRQRRYGVNQGVEVVFWLGNEGGAVAEILEDGGEGHDEEVVDFRGGDGEVDVADGKAEKEDVDEFLVEVARPRGDAGSSKGELEVVDDDAQFLIELPKGSVHGALPSAEVARATHVQFPRVRILELGPALNQDVVAVDDPNVHGSMPIPVAVHFRPRLRRSRRHRLSHAHHVLGFRCIVNIKRLLLILASRITPIWITTDPESWWHLRLAFVPVAFFRSSLRASNLWTSRGLSIMR